MTKLNDLPNELIEHIAGQLDASDLLRVRLVDRHMSIGCSDAFDKTFFEHRHILLNNQLSLSRFVRAAEIERFAKHFQQLTVYIDELPCTRVRSSCDKLITMIKSLFGKCHPRKVLLHNWMNLVAEQTALRSTGQDIMLLRSAFRDQAQAHKNNRRFPITLNFQSGVKDKASSVHMLRKLTGCRNMEPRDGDGAAVEKVLVAISNSGLKVENMLIESTGPWTFPAHWLDLSFELRPHLFYGMRFLKSLTIDVWSDNLRSAQRFGQILAILPDLLTLNVKSTKALDFTIPSAILKFKYDVLRDLTLGYGMINLNHLERFIRINPTLQMISFADGLHLFMEDRARSVARQQRLTMSNSSVSMKAESAKSAACIAVVKATVCSTRFRTKKIKRTGLKDTHPN